MNKFINNRQKEMYTVLKESLEECKEFCFIVSFIRFSGVQIILDILKEAERKNIKGKIITTDYMEITEKKALEKLMEFSNLELKFFDSKEKGFHPKGYIFIYEKETKIIIGSSNISKGGLKSNIEWNNQILLENQNVYIEEVLEEFNFFWSHSKDYDKSYFKNSQISNSNQREKDKEESRVKPNYMQEIGLENLKRIRENGEKRALGVATTGTGKTYLAAFDVEREKPKKVLFLVHREEILNSALKTFKSIIKDKSFGKYTGNKKEKSADYIFATVQSIHKNLEDFPKNNFQYIVLDEAHHTTGKTYRKILEYFDPNFLLGLTATPERADGVDIYEFFHGNIVMEIRMSEALNKKLIAPFHYFGISDIKEINLSDLQSDRIDELAKRLMVNKRTEHIVEKIYHYGYSGKKMKGIGFCANVDHAKYMVEEFKRKGIESVALTGENSSEERERKIKKLQNEDDSLEIIFTVDIFNEGVDIPEVNLILMLRPTDSPVIFLQQLGRGLRKNKDKEFLTVLDFIGNHKKSFLVALALTGNQTYDKDSLKIALKNNFKALSSEIFISMDKVSKEAILNQIENENFNSVKYLKEEYLSFKNILKKVPSYLDFFHYEGAPNILKFILKYKSYYKFLKTIGEEYPFKEKEYIFFTEEQIKIVEQIERAIPIKRVNEYAIIKYLLENEYLDIDKGVEEISNYIQISDKKSLEHSFNYLQGDYGDEGEKRREVELFKKEKNRLMKKTVLKENLESVNFKNYLKEVLTYGLLTYEKQFGNKNYGTPFLKCFEKYSMRDVALLSNYGKLHSSYRNGINMSEDKKDFYLFITLNKDKEGFENLILDRRRFYWYTKESTSKNSEIGKNFIKSKERGIKLHFFIRKFNKIDNITEEFFYLGLGEVEESYGENPIKCKIKLKEKIKEEIYWELLEIV